MTDFQIPGRLFEFIERSRFEWVVHPDGVVEFGPDLARSTTSLWRVVPRGDGWVDVWDVNEWKMGGEAFWDSSFPSWDLAERRLLWQLGNTVRRLRGLPTVFVPRYIEFQDARCEVRIVAVGERERAQLWCDGALLGEFRNTAPTAGDVFAASHVMPEETDLIVSSFLDTEGKPLFSTEITPVPQ